MKNSIIFALFISAALFTSCTNNKENTEETEISPSLRLTDGTLISQDDIEERSPAAYGNYFYYLSISIDDTSGYYDITIPKLKQNSDGSYTSLGNLQSNVAAADITWSDQGDGSAYLDLGGTGTGGSGEEYCQEILFYPDYLQMHSLNTASGHVLAITSGPDTCFFAMNSSGDVENIYHSYLSGIESVIAMSTSGINVAVIGSAGSSPYSVFTVAVSDIFTGDENTYTSTSLFTPPVFPNVITPMNLVAMSDTSIAGNTYYVMLYYGFENDLALSVTPTELYPYLPKLVFYNVSTQKFVSMEAINFLFKGPIETFSISDTGRLYLSGIRLNSTLASNLSGTLLSDQNAGWSYDYNGGFSDYSLSLYRVTGPTLGQMQELLNAVK